MSKVVLIGAMLAGFLLGRAEAQHVTIDGTLSPAQTLTGPNYRIGAGLGLLKGPNLFHSFGNFSLSAGESATFTGPSTVTNVIGRVTGGAPSSINGTITSQIAGANLYVINPAGVMFGPNASINVSGSFHASSADYLKLSDGTRFQATHPNSGSSLTVAPPAAFGFLGAPNAGVSVNGSTLTVPTGATLGLVGGPVSVTGTLKAPGGVVHVTSGAGAGEVPVDPTGGAAITANPLGSVALSQATINVNQPLGVSNGSVFINAAALTLSASQIDGDAYHASGGGQISLRGDSLVSLDNTTSVHAISLNASGSGTGISIITGSNGAVSLANGSSIYTVAAGGGKGGDINLTAGSLVLDGNGSTVSSSTIGQGIGGSVNVAAGSVHVENNASVTTAGTGSGAAGALTVTSAGDVEVVSGFITSTTNGGGRSGDVNVSAMNGTITVGASGSITANAVPPAGSGGGQTAAQVTLSAQAIKILGGGSVGSNASGASGAGDVRLTANGDISNGGVVNANTFGSGDAGNVTVNAMGGSISNSGSISAGTISSGNAGNVTVMAAGDVTMSGSGGGSSNYIATNSGYEGVDGKTNFGSAGNVSVTGQDIRLSGGAFVSAETFGAGSGGSVSVRPTGTLTIDGTTTANSPSFIGAQAYGMGPAGSVSVSGGTVVSLLNGAQIKAEAASGAGGNVTVQASDLLLVQQTKSIISASVDGAAGNGGNVTISAPQIVFEGGRLVAQAYQGTGGDIKVMAGEFITSPFPDTLISASSQVGQNGNVTVSAPSETVTAGLVELSGKLLNAGRINREACSVSAQAERTSSVVVGSPGALPRDGTGPQPGYYFLGKTPPVTGAHSTRPEMGRQAMVAGRATAHSCW